MGNSPQEQYIELTRKIIDREFSHLNPRQREAVYQTYGPTLILAGAGSGKTTVLVNKIAYMVKYGDAYHAGRAPEGIDGETFEMLRAYYESGAEDPEIEELLAVDPVRPYHILAITFTNKAAGELKERLVKKLGDAGNDVWASTFHACCTRILRRDADRIGLAQNFTIYDTDDSKKVIRDCMKQIGVIEKNFPVGAVLSAIGRAKDNLLSPAEFRAQAKDDYRLQTIGRLYEMYDARLKAADAMDFDDIIFNTVRLLQQDEQTRAYYQNKFRNIVVDEYQDTNHAQYVLISLLAGKWGNLCVVGDDDQSIYKFRGATIENILSFEKQYEDCSVIRLEQNYRSTKVILDSANHAIQNNSGRKGKTLWTDNAEGEPIKVFGAHDEYFEGRFIVDQILEEVKKGRRYSDIAVLYRANAQSSAIEEALLKNGLPYRIFGGQKFYERMEVKDVTSYLCVVNNPADNLRLKRIVNTPKRGIGDTTVALCEELAESGGISIYEVMQNADRYMQLERVAGKLRAFVDLIEQLRGMQSGSTLSEYVKQLMEKTGYAQYIAGLDEQDGRDRMSNLETLISNVEHYEENAEEPTLQGFMEEVSLATDLDTLSEDGSYVALLTLHGAKGLEFPVVFIAGMEEEVFPSSHAVLDITELEEERRLAYVGITRAKEQLYLTYAKQRRTFKGMRYHKVSRFLEEIPEKNLLELGIKPTAADRAARRETVRTGERFAAERQKSNFLAGSAPKQAAAKPAELFEIGQTVQHGTFGKGVVLAATPVGGDQMLEIAFETVGTKKLMANYAKLTRLES